MKFYTWRQNNSGGRYKRPAAFVSIQATSLGRSWLVVYLDGRTESGA